MYYYVLSKYDISLNSAGHSGSVLLLSEQGELTLLAGDELCDDYRACHTGRVFVETRGPESNLKPKQAS